MTPDALKFNSDLLLFEWIIFFMQNLFRGLWYVQNFSVIKYSENCFPNIFIFVIFFMPNFSKLWKILTLWAKQHFIQEMMIFSIFFLDINTDKSLASSRKYCSGSIWPGQCVNEGLRVERFLFKKMNFGLQTMYQGRNSSEYSVWRIQQWNNPEQEIHRYIVR